MSNLLLKPPVIPWNKNKITGQKRPLKISHIWGIRIRLELTNNIRDLALFNLALDSKLRGCDLLVLKVKDVANGGVMQSRAIITQKKTGSPVQFEITSNTRNSLTQLIKQAQLTNDDYIFKSRLGSSQHLSTRQYSRILLGWIEALGLDTSLYGTHSMRRTKPYLIYQKTKNIRAIQLLLGHKKLEGTVRYLGIEVDDAIEISKSIEI
ncbi:MAG: tyrosine-type recombinase/integrase [Thalassotalea sp.]|nr:tyrosine-type recombinase/integrase [Thalassotalea sp.]